MKLQGVYLVVMMQLGILLFLIFVKFIKRDAEHEQDY